VRPEGLGKLKKFIHPIGSRTCKGEVKIYTESKSSKREEKGERGMGERIRDAFRRVRAATRAPEG
jgi:hypothetical protein